MLVASILFCGLCLLRASNFLLQKKEEDQIRANDNWPPGRAGPGRTGAGRRGPAKGDGAGPLIDDVTAAEHPVARIASTANLISRR